eukprot:TRINITY_DN4003_c0_g1_i1.p1 TRINITY_DN4003_c0_g1~~TRINITY_DN4003_c0_g1_i1.p1  ORF type:complete len:173 (+),score=47.20 TRINITY_DN4003_c0_g1_i1:316-834(+)
MAEVEKRVVVEGMQRGNKNFLFVIQSSSVEIPCNVSMDTQIHEVLAYNYGVPLNVLTESMNQYHQHTENETNQTDDGHPNPQGEENEHSDFAEEGAPTVPLTFTLMELLADHILNHGNDDENEEAHGTQHDDDNRGNGGSGGGENEDDDGEEISSFDNEDVPNATMEVDTES